MKVQFPNPYGQPAPRPERVREFQEKIGFSNAYCEFLTTQNGFSLLALEQASNHSMFLCANDATHEGRANLRELYSFRANDPHYDLEEQQADNLFASHFLLIGSDPAGNPFVEILIGQHKGKIGSLDHDLFICASDLSELFTNLDIAHLTTASSAQQADALCDPAQGLVWFHAPGMKEFIQHCIHCDMEDFWGFVVDHPAS